ncbi:TPA: hypothetical protein ACH3X1_000420 [Trebouxia sp. C0004]
MAISRIALFDSESIALLGPAFRQSQACISVHTGAAVPDKQASNKAANIPTPKHAPVGAGKAVPAFPSPSANGVVSSGKATPANASIPGKGALPAAKASPAKPPAAGSNKAVLPALPKSPAQDKAVPSKPGSAKHGSDRQVEAGPKPGVTPLQDLSNGTKPARSSASSPLKDCAKSSHSADRKAVSDGTAATRLAGSKLDQPAAELRSSTSKESKSLTSSVLDKGKSHSSSSSSNTGMHAFSKGMSPHGLVKGRAACKSSHHPKSRRAADGSSRTVSSTGVVSAQSPPQTEHSHSAFSPFRCVTGQQAEGQQDKSKAAPQLAAMATTWSNPMFAYSTAPPSFCGAAQASSLVPDDQAKPKAHSQTEPLPLEPARQPLTTAAAAAELDKSSPALDNLIRQMQLLTIAACCASFSSEQESVLPAVADPADALQRSADAAQASSVPSGTLSSSDLNMPPKAHLVPAVLIRRPCLLRSHFQRRSLLHALLRLQTGLCLHFWRRLVLTRTMTTTGVAVPPLTVSSQIWQVQWHKQHRLVSLAQNKPRVLLQPHPQTSHGLLLLASHSRHPLSQLPKSTNLLLLLLLLLGW